jgi:glycosyltransferase involved in cell wall biosynthesis
MLVRMMDCLPPQYHLLLAGDGPLAPLLRAVGEQRRIKLVQQNDLAALYAGADAFVDGALLGDGPLQAMAAGVPLVAANAGAVPSYVIPENAWLTQPTPDALADAITQLWRMPLEQVRARTAQARSTAEQHDWPIIAKRCFAQFDELIASKSCC